VALAAGEDATSNKVDAEKKRLDKAVVTCMGTIEIFRKNSSVCDVVAENKRKIATATWPYMIHNNSEPQDSIPNFIKNKTMLIAVPMSIANIDLLFHR